MTAQTLVQQVAYTLSDKIYSYSLDSFDLDAGIKTWTNFKTRNGNGNVTDLSSMQSRAGAGSIALGYMFSKDFDLAKRHTPQSLLATSGNLPLLRSVLDQLSLLYSVANPLVAHVAAIDYAAAGLVTDYVKPQNISEELGLGLLCSTSTYEIQHMSLLATLAASILPMLHVYDGIHSGSETVRVIDVLSRDRVVQLRDAVLSDTFRNPRQSTEARFGEILDAFNTELGTAYDVFEYSGHKAPETVMVVFGSVEASLARQVVERLAAQNIKVGAINVRLYRPFFEERFLQVLKGRSTVRNIIVLGQVVDDDAVNDVNVHSALYEDVLVAISFSTNLPSISSVIDRKYARDEVFTPSSIATIVLQSAEKQAELSEHCDLLSSQHVDQYTFWDFDDSSSAAAAVVIGKVLSLDSASNIVIKETHDNLKLGGIRRTDLRASSKSIEAPFRIQNADVVFVGDIKLCRDVDVLTDLKHGGILAIKLDGFKDDELEKHFPPLLRRRLVEKQATLWIVDPAASTRADDPPYRIGLTQLAFLQIAEPDTMKSRAEKLTFFGQDTGSFAQAQKELETMMHHVLLPEAWLSVEEVATSCYPPSAVKPTSFVDFDKDEAVEPSLLTTWHSAAKGLLFKEAYEATTSLRPDLSVKTYQVEVKENRRLTPDTYDRNIFHIEFDLGTSGLKYDIGEALGIHAENNHEEVEEFMRWYDLDPTSLVELASRDNPSKLETRTVYQSLIHNIDIFGKPPKRFYEALADFATDSDERKNLLSLAGPEGAGEFKRRSEVDTVTYYDVLQEFPSAHPHYHDLARIISPMKRREYSIASAQAVTPTTIALMIVVVSWVDPKGRDRFGQATKYLSNLPVGAKVTVSVKPSVMKLPSTSSAPLIMAGLGTGLAPFRAFVQYRAMQMAQGLPIGSILLYMGSRHQREEYLYGEEWEAYQAAGVITLLGRAFSRDQPEKIYIQDRMRQTLADIAKAYVDDEGSFYLCGPTWPVPDVTEVLEEAVEHAAQLAGVKKDRRKEIERLKEAGRFVLEVY